GDHVDLLEIEQPAVIVERFRDLPLGGEALPVLAIRRSASYHLDPRIAGVSVRVQFGGEPRPDETKTDHVHKEALSSHSAFCSASLRAPRLARSSGLKMGPGSNRRGAETRSKTQRWMTAKLLR